MQRRQVHRPDADALDPISAGTAPRIPSDAGVSAPVRTAARRATGRSAEPPERVGEDRGGAVVEPLDVVDRDQDGPIRSGELAQEPGDRHRQRPLVRRGAGRLDAQERDLERAALRRGQSAQGVVVDPAQEVGQPAEREPLLGSAGRAESTRQPRAAPSRRPPPRRSTCRSPPRPRRRAPPGRRRRARGTARPPRARRPAPRPQPPPGPPHAARPITATAGDRTPGPADALADADGRPFAVAAMSTHRGTVPMGVDRAQPRSRQPSGSVSRCVEERTLARPSDFATTTVADVLELQQTAGNAAVAEALAGQSCPIERHRWEWHYLKRLTTTELLSLVRVHTSGNSAVFSPDGRRIAIGDGSFTRIFDAATGQPGRFFSSQEGKKVRAIAFEATNRQVAVLCIHKDNRYYLNRYDPDNGNEIRSQFVGEDVSRKTSAETGNTSLGERLERESKSCIWPRERRSPCKAEPTETNRLVFSPNGEWLAGADPRECHGVERENGRVGARTNRRSTAANGVRSSPPTVAASSSPRTSRSGKFGTSRTVENFDHCPPTTIRRRRCERHRQWEVSGDASRLAGIDALGSGPRKARRHPSRAVRIGAWLHLVPRNRLVTRHIDNRVKIWQVPWPGR